MKRAIFTTRDTCYLLFYSNRLISILPRQISRLGIRRLWRIVSPGSWQTRHSERTVTSPHICILWDILEKLLLHAYCGLISIDILRHFRAIEPVRLSRSEKRAASFPIAQTLTVRYKNLIGLAEWRATHFDFLSNSPLASFFVFALLPRHEIAMASRHTSGINSARVSPFFFVFARLVLRAVSHRFLARSRGGKNFVDCSGR